MTLAEARDALYAQYVDQKLIPYPLIGVKVGVYETRDVLQVYVNLKSPPYVPEESKPGVGFQGYEVVAYRGLATVVSDSGVIG